MPMFSPSRPNILSRKPKEDKPVAKPGVGGAVSKTGVAAFKKLIQSKNKPVK